MVADGVIGSGCVPACDVLDAIETERQNDHVGHCISDSKQYPCPDQNLPSALKEIFHDTAEEEQNGDLQAARAD